ncbi:MAG TPA: pilus assembly protein TadG-related protein [Gemmataceae bacterium]|nr:pilus assembly protein TadG-related protein [Gemmataceae bacterium]
MRSSPVRSNSFRNSSVMPLTLLSLSLLVSMVALVVDGGTLIEDRRHVQAAADTAALAAAADLFTNYNTNHGTDPSGTAKASALSTAAANGFNHDGVQSTVTVSVSPSAYQSGPNAGKKLPAGYVEVNLQYNADRLFSGMFGSGTIPVRARAVARGIWGADSNGVILLSLKASGALSDSSSSPLLISGGLEVNSKSSTAISITSLGTVTASQFNLNQAAGSLGGSLLSHLSGLSGASPTVNYGSPAPDPLRNLAEPDPVALGLTQQGTNLHISSGTKDLYPGIYKGGITVSGGATAILHANSDGTPGIYYLQGGGLTISGPSTMKMATGETAGVMIYNDWSSSANAIVLSGSGTLTINPPASGLYEGISIFQKRGTLTSAAPTLTLSGSGTMNITGTIYAAYAKVSMSGSSGTNVMGGQLIADRLTLTGSATISINPGTNPIANTRKLGLVE